MAEKLSKRLARLETARPGKRQEDPVIWMCPPGSREVETADDRALVDAVLAEARARDDLHVLWPLCDGEGETWQQSD